MKKIHLFFNPSLMLVYLISISPLYSGTKEWPKKPVTVYVGWSAGGTSDIVTRAAVREMEKQLGQKFFVTNVTGAIGAIGASQVARAPADGYSLFGGAAVHGTWPILQHSEVSWTNFYSFLGVVFPTTIYVLKDAPWNTIQDLVEDIRNHPNKQFKCAHQGTGSNGQLFAGLIMRAAGIQDKVVFIPYRGGMRAAGIQDKVVFIPYRGGREAGRYLLSGETQFASVSTGDLIDWAVAGRIRPLSTLFTKDLVVDGIEFPSILNVYPELEVFQAINPYWGIYVNRKTPDEIVTRIAKTFITAIQQNYFQKIAVEERAGILMPRLGRAADEQMSKIESARGWILYRLGVAPVNPSTLGVPELNAWSWPPHQRAAELLPWPDSVSSMVDEIKKVK